MNLTGYINIFCVLLFSDVYSQAKILTRYYVKPDRIIFRIVPENIESYEAINTCSLQVTRCEKNNDGICKETMLVQCLKQYASADILTWSKLIKKDRNKFSFVYQSLYNNKYGSKSGAAQHSQQQKMIYDMLLLSCDHDAEVAKACGLYFQDSVINPKVKYQYKIYLLSEETKSLLQIIEVDPSVLSENIKLNNLSGKGKNGVAAIEWNAGKTGTCYSGFNVERSEDSIHYSKINTAPVILFTNQGGKNKEHLSYFDTMPLKHRDYFYRIKGINFFGEQSEPSNTIKIYSAPAITSAPKLDSVITIQNRKVLLKWGMLNRNEEKSVKEFVLVRSEKEKGPYNLIYNGRSTSYTDSSLLRINFYKAGVITFDGDTLFSYSRYATIIDTIPPDSPAGLNAVVAKNGIVTIRWRKNKEKDLKGYKLFRSNSLSEEFVQINNKFICDTFYVERLHAKSLTRDVFYCISSVDDNFNNSRRTAIVKVSRPDTIPPVKPTLKLSGISPRGVQLRFVLSKSRDVANQTIMRKSSTDTMFHVICSVLSDSVAHFSDSTVINNNRYQYKIEARDSSGNISSSNIIVLNYEAGYRKKMTDIKYKVDRDLKSIYLEWNYSESEIEKFVLYRGKEKYPVSILKVVDGNVFNYKDYDLYIGNVYVYRVKAVMFSGTESMISDAIKIKY